MARSVPLSRFTSRVGGGSAFFVRPLDHFTFMDKNKAAALIRQHRRHWMSSASDYSIARRAEHVYTNVVVMMLSLMVWLFTLDSSLLFRWVMVVLILCFVGFGCKRVRQFREIRREFEETWPQNLSDLDSRQRPNKSPEPTAVGACSSAVAVHVASRRWLSFFR